MECFAYNQLHQIAFCLHLWHPYKNMYMLCRQPITLSVDALFLADFTKKYSKTKPYVALYPLKAVITRPADILAVIKTFVQPPIFAHSFLVSLIGFLGRVGACLMRDEV